MGVQSLFLPCLKLAAPGVTGMLKCVECGGRKEVPCTRCRASASHELGHQEKSCECCKHKGKVKCPACGGTGKAGPSHDVAADC